MGYSDNTNFSFLLNTLCDVAAVYGPHASDFGMNPSHPAVDDAMLLLKGKLSFNSYDKWELEKIKDENNPYLGYNCTEDSCIKSYLNGEEKEVSFSGRIIGGCIDVLSNICGTRFDKVSEFAEKYKEDGIVWFLEACDLSPMDFRRTLWKLKESGWFKHVKGFVFGRPGRFGEESFGMGFEEAALSMVSEFGVPVVLNADIGHHPPAIPVLAGSICKINVNEKLSVEYRLM